MKNESMEISVFERMWRNKTVKKAATVLVIFIIILIVPLSCIRSRVQQVETINKEQLSHSQHNWTNHQEMNGPYLSIPLDFTGNDTPSEKNHLTILPTTLSIHCQEKKQSPSSNAGLYPNLQTIYQVSGTFDLNEIPNSYLDNSLPTEAFLSIGISDISSIKDVITVHWNNQTTPAYQGSKLRNVVYQGVSASTPIPSNYDSKIFTFSFEIVLNPSQQFTIIPLGAATSISYLFDGITPSFIGNFSPSLAQINENITLAEWNVLGLNHDQPHFFHELVPKEAFASSAITIKKKRKTLEKSAINGLTTSVVKLIFIVFLVTFLCERFGAVQIHPFQYFLIGVGLCCFFYLLVSISEHSSFNIAYSIATLTIVTLVSFYSISVFKKIKLSVLLGTSLFALYGFHFATLKLEDYALLLSSIAITFILAATMYFTRNINWYQSQKIESQ